MELEPAPLELGPFEVKAELSKWSWSCCKWSWGRFGWSWSRPVGIRAVSNFAGGFKLVMFCVFGQNMLILGIC